MRKSGNIRKGTLVLLDCGFTMENDLKELKIDFNILSFLAGRAQLMAAAVKESQTIASVRIHVECAIQRLKKFKVIRKKMPLTLHGSANQL